jgi:viologen exporter family transport system permease protein
MLRFYIEVARTAFRRQLIYRWANLAGLCTNVFWGVIQSAVYIALYRSRPVAAGYSLADTLRYWWLIQGMIMIVLPFGWFDLLLTIRSGEVVTDLSKPCDFYWYWFSREVGRDAYYLLFRFLPTYTAGLILFRIGLPGDWRTWTLFGFSLVLGAGVGIAYRFISNIAAFWVIEGRPVAGMVYTVALFLTGSYLPVAFFPPLLRTLIDWSPFSALMNVPAEVFGGKIAESSLALALGQQVLWLVALTLAARGLTRLAARRVVVQGG